MGYFDQTPNNYLYEVLPASWSTMLIHIRAHTGICLIQPESF